MSDLQQQQAPEQSPPPIPGEDAPPAPIEIELDEGGEVTEAPPEPEQVAQPEPPAPKPKKSARDRVQEALREATAERQMREQLERELQEARGQAQAARAAEQAALQAGMQNYAQRVKAEAEQAQQELEAAYATNDAKIIAEANRKVAKVAAAEADVEAWQESARQQAQQPQPPQQPQAPVQPQEQPLPAPVAEFLLENDWFDRYQRTSDGRTMTDAQGRALVNPNFDAHMHDAAMLMHKRIEWEKERNMWSGEIGSPEYFARIREGMEAQFPEYFADTEHEPPPIPTRRTPPMSQTRQPVAPASRTSMPNSPRPNGANKVTLSGEERQLVDSMVANGSMRYPSGHKQQGQVMQPIDAYRAYAQQAQVTRTNNQN